MSMIESEGGGPKREVTVRQPYLCQCASTGAAAAANRGKPLPLSNWVENPLMDVSCRAMGTRMIKPIEPHSIGIRLVFFYLIRDFWVRGKVKHVEDRGGVGGFLVHGRRKQVLSIYG